MLWGHILSRRLWRQLACLKYKCICSIRWVENAAETPPLFASATLWKNTLWFWQCCQSMGIGFIPRTDMKAKAENEGFVCSMWIFLWINMGLWVLKFQVYVLHIPTTATFQTNICTNECSKSSSGLLLLQDIRVVALLFFWCSFLLSHKDVIHLWGKWMVSNAQHLYLD